MTLIFDNDTLNTSNISTDDRNESRPIKRIDDKRLNKEFEKTCFRMPLENWGVPQPKLGLTPIKKRNVKIWRLVLHVAAEECHCVWTDFKRDGAEQERYHVEKGRRGL